MRKAFALFLAAALLMGFAACATPAVPTEPATTPTTASTTAATEPTTPADTEDPATEPATEPTTGSTAVTDPTATAAPTDPTEKTEGTTVKTTIKTTKVTTTVSTAPTTKGTTAPLYPELRSFQLIPDPDFQNGFNIGDWLTGKVVGTWEPAGASTDKTAWQVAQWGTKRCIWGDNTSKKSTVLDDGYKVLTFDKKEKSISLCLDSFDILGNDVYNAASGYTWPHLLIEQGDFGYRTGSKTADFYTGKAEHLIFSFDMKMDYYENINYGGPNNCQLVAFFYIHAEGGGFVWFGVPIFESRDFYTQTSPYYALDVASNSYIYTLPFHYGYEAFEYGDIYHDKITRKAQADSRWNHYEIDLKPWMEKMAALAIADGFFPTAKSVEDLYINGMNLGYEMGSCFVIDTTFKNMRLTSYLK